MLTTYGSERCILKVKNKELWLFVSLGSKTTDNGSITTTPANIEIILWPNSMD